MMEIMKVNQIGETISATPVDEARFQSEQKSLLETVNQGVSIREQNQQIAPANSPANAGLATVAMAQKEEVALTQSLALQGNNTAQAKATVTKLQEDFRGGLQQNMLNLMAVSLPPVPLHEYIY